MRLPVLFRGVPSMRFRITRHPVQGSRCRAK
jgi:hypothetical protein